MLSLNEKEKKSKSEMITSCSYPEGSFEEDRKKVESGPPTVLKCLDMTTRTKRLGVKEKTRGKSLKQRTNTISRKKALQRQVMRKRIRKLLKMRVVSARIW